MKTTSGNFANVDCTQGNYLEEVNFRILMIFLMDNIKNAVEYLQVWVWN